MWAKLFERVAAQTNKKLEYTFWRLFQIKEENNKVGDTPVPSQVR